VAHDVRNRWYATCTSSPLAFAAGRIFLLWSISRGLDPLAADPRSRTASRRTWRRWMPEAPAKYADVAGDQSLLQRITTP
jgi:hypothetical protein